MLSRVLTGCSSSRAIADDLPPPPILDALGGERAYKQISKLLLQDLNFAKTKKRLDLIYSYTSLEEGLKSVSSPKAIFQATIYETKCKKKSETKATFIVIKVLDRMTKANSQLQAILLQLPRKIYFCYTFTATDQLICIKQNFEKALKVVKALLNKGSLAHYPPLDNEYSGEVYMVTSNHPLLTHLNGRIVLYDFNQDPTDEKSEDGDGDIRELKC